MKRYALTSKIANPVKHFWIENTRRKIVLSYSTRTHKGAIVDFLGIKLRVVRPAGATGSNPGVLATTGVLIPASWFIDLSVDVPEDEQEPAGADLV